MSFSNVGTKTFENIFKEHYSLHSLQGFYKTIIKLSHNNAKPGSASVSEQRKRKWEIIEKSLQRQVSRFVMIY